MKIDEAMEATKDLPPWATVHLEKFAIWGDSSKQGFVVIEHQRYACSATWYTWPGSKRARLEYDGRSDGKPTLADCIKQAIEWLEKYREVPDASNK